MHAKESLRMIDMKKVKKINFSVYPGAKIGAWLVMEECGDGKNRRWNCRCDCGTQRTVLDRSLRYGGSMSCGCQSRKRIMEKQSNDLSGRRFGSLTVSKQAESIHGRIGRCWLCICDCGREIIVPGTELLTERRDHCGCRTSHNFMFQDITARKFGRIKALYPLEETTRKGNPIWHCICDCGKELEFSCSRLMSGNVQSCGCASRKIENDAEEINEKWKLPKNNTSGMKGVYINQGRYEAVYTFKGKRYWLGAYTLFADAVRMRHEAERIFQDQALPAYKHWKQHAKADPDWAESNPLKIELEIRNGTFLLHISPDI